MTKFERDAILQPGEYASIPKDVLSLKVLTPAAKLVYIMLLEAEGPERRLTIQDSEIAAKTGLSRRTVQLARQQLRQIGLADFTAQASPRNKRGQFKAGNPGNRRGGVRCKICALDNTPNGAKIAPQEGVNGAEFAPPYIDNPSIDNPPLERAAKPAPAKKSAMKATKKKRPAVVGELIAKWAEGLTGRNLDFTNRGQVAGTFKTMARNGWAGKSAELVQLVVRWFAPGRPDYGIELFRARINGGDRTLELRGPGPPKGGGCIPVESTRESYNPKGAIDHCGKGAAA